MRPFAVLPLLLAACSSPAAGPDGGIDGDGGAGEDAVGDDAYAHDSGGPCQRFPGPADRARAVVVSHPYTDTGGPAVTWRVLTLSVDGTLSDDGPTFEMGRATGGEIAFTPDGEIGLVAQEDGTLGAFTIDAAGTPTVLHQALAGSFYAARVVMDPSGARAWVVDPNWRKNGGGLYSVSIGCDGTITDQGLQAQAKLPAALSFLDDGRAVLAAADLLSSTAGADAHLIAPSVGIGVPPDYLGGVDAFGDDEAIVAGAAVTADGRFFLIGDNSAFSGIPNRIAVVEILSGGLTATQVLSPVDDPISLVASPFDNTVLVASGFSNALIAIDYDGSAATPFTVRGEIAYAGAPPQLPGGAVVIQRGMLRGRVLVAENLGVRQAVFAPGGSITDLGLTSLGAGLTSIVGAVGVQP